MHAMYEKTAVVATIDPANHGIGGVATDYVDMGRVKKAMFVLSVGAMAAGATVDFVLQEAQNAAGLLAQPIAGKAIQQLTQAGGDANTQVIVHIDAAELTDGFPFVGGLLTVGVAGVDASVIALGGEPRYAPVAHLASVVEVVD